MGNRHARYQVSNFECRIGWNYLPRRVELPRWLERAGIVYLRHVVIGEAQNLPQDLVGMFAEQRRARDLGRAVRHLDGIADREIFAALGMIDLDHGAGGAQRLILDQFLHRQDRTAGDVVLVENVHRLELGLGHGPLLDAGEDFIQPRQPGRRLGVVGVGLPAGFADDVANFLPDRRLGDEIDVGVRIGLPALALQDAARLTAAGIIAGARHRVAERNAFTVLAVPRWRPRGRGRRTP